MRLRATASACALSLCLASCGAANQPTTASPGKRTTASAAKLATAAAYAFLNTYTVDGGRIQRTDQGGDTVGEGQAYGMLAAAAVGNQQRFDRIWSWTQHNMQDPNGLLAFHWVNGRVVDPTPAADADLDAARALLVASCRFRQPDLRTAAIRIGRALLAQETANAGSSQILLAGPWANKGSYLVFNPSYVDPTTLNALATVTGDPQFRAVAASSSRLVEELMMPLPPNWAIINTATGQATPVSGPNATSGPGLFTYDAPRALLRLAENPDAAAQKADQRAWSVFKYTPPQNIATEHQLSGAALGYTHDPVTLVAAAAAAKAAGNTRAMSELLNEAQQLNAQHPTYYGSAWVALGRLYLTTNLLQPCV